MPAGPPASSSRNKIVACVLINLCATPGLGSLLARRIVAGAGQLVLAVAGFVLLMVWMGRWFHGLWLRQLDQPPPPGSFHEIGQWGLISFGIAWLWSLATSLSLLRQDPETGNDATSVPPRLTN